MGIGAASVLAGRRCARALLLVQLAAVGLACAAGGFPTVAFDLPMPVLIGPVLYVGSAVPEEGAPTAALPAVSHLQARAKQSREAFGSTSSSAGPVTATVHGGSTEHEESSFDMEPMTIPRTSAVAIITTIAVHCWGMNPGMIYTECQVIVEGDVYPKEAFDPGSAEP